MQQVQSFAKGQWIAPGSGARPIANAVTGRVFAQAGNDDLDFGGMIDYAKSVGGPALRAMNFHERAWMVKDLARYLHTRREDLYEVSFATGATQKDQLIDIDGGIGTMFVFSSKGRREMPDDRVYLEGDLEQLSRNGTFVGQHILTPMHGVAVQINAFNFPVWGMLEKLAPALLAGMPTIVKPATVSCYVTELCVAMMVESGHLPDGAVQLVTGGLGDTLDLLGCQDIVTFTGSATTAMKLRSNRNLLENSVRFTAEQDSLNASVLGPDAVYGAPEFDLFVKEVTREMTTKAGQKCTAVRRLIVPDDQVQPVIEALSFRLAKTVIGDPRVEGVRMGALVSADQKADVLAQAEQIRTEAACVYGQQDEFAPVGEGVSAGAFVTPMLFHCADPDAATKVHSTEAFGPVSTVMGYRDTDHAMALANKGQGSLVASVFTRDGGVARDMALGISPYHGRLYFNNRDSAGEATGHGSPLPHMVHGGPGRAGGGEELGGIRAVKHFMQRTAIQGSPDIISAVSGKWAPGATQISDRAHPFTRRFHDLDLGETILTQPRIVTLEDIEHFAAFTGDTFYAHMDSDAAKRNPFFPGRVAHGYLLLSFAAGLFVEPNEGPVLANTGLDNLRFMKPVEPDDTIRVSLTVTQKKKRTQDYGEVRWHVRLTNQDDDIVAEYELLTMVAF